jgi:hypothetical protein
MGIEITVDVDPRYICVHCTGRFSPRAYEQTVRTAVDAVLVYDIPRVLIDATDVEGILSQTDLTSGPAYLVAEAQERAPGMLQKLAFVCDEAHFDPLRRGEMVANEGGIPTRVFTDSAAAIEWLVTPVARV